MGVVMMLDAWLQDNRAGSLIQLLLYIGGNMRYADETVTINKYL